jgi:predicted RNase H-like nuclease (RuvC/YqgF family)
VISSEDYYEAKQEAIDSYDVMNYEREIEALLKELEQQREEIDQLTWQLCEAELRLHQLGVDE